MDIDGEYPDGGESARNYTAMMRVLREEMHARGRLLTAAGVGKGPLAERIPDEVFGYGIMAYDGGDGPARSPYSYAVEALDYWLGWGLAPEKVVLASPSTGGPNGWSSGRWSSWTPTRPRKMR